MNKGLIQLLNMMAVGPVVCILVVAAALSVIVIAALFGKTTSLTTYITLGCDDLDSQTGLSLLRGLASFALLFLAKFSTTAHFFLIQLLGILVLLAGAGFLAIGFAIGCRIIGKRLLNRSQVLSQKTELLWGTSIVVAVALLPVAGWLVAALAALSGMGAMINVTLQRRSRNDEPRGSSEY